MKGFSLLRISLVALWAVLVTAPASATFPGKNGRIAFVQDGEIFTMNPDGTDIRQITHVGPDTAANWPAWSANGRAIVFNETPPGGVAELWIMNADGSKPHLLLSEPNFAENRPSFSPDGSRVVFGRCDLLIGDGDTCAIYTVASNGTDLRPVTQFLRDTTARSPMYSPDGRTLAFILSNDSAAGFLGVTYLIEADGSNQRRVTDPAPCLIRPDWSPDGTRITLFAHLCNPENEKIAVMDADGSDVRYLTDNGKDFYHGPHDRNPAFSPDGQFIVFERNPPDLSSSALYVMRANGSELRSVLVLPRPQSSSQRSNHRRNRLTKIEEGGSVPRWGVAPE